MAKEPIKAVLDTNIILSAILFGGKPKQILQLVQTGEIVAVTSNLLLAELTEVLVKKFHFTKDKIILTEAVIKENFIIVYPQEIFHIVDDQDDNRVLEAAVAGSCKYIITGDQDLLGLNIFQKIKIVTADKLLAEVIHL